ncbi:hypothetical protein BKA70DRAFT_1574351 [Coprinopsis sp. MPI-PUGE-AT-0042]|nr:hypothetical protein BKA70DRAFT_1574351 [Coprinopsis sp. MPI-PUGE-AT-0042]
MSPIFYSSSRPSSPLLPCLIQTIASFVSRKSKIPSGLKSRREFDLGDQRGCGDASCSCSRTRRSSLEDLVYEHKYDESDGWAAVCPEETLWFEGVFADGIAQYVSGGFTNSKGDDEDGQTNGTVSACAAPTGGPAVFPSAIASEGARTPSFTVLAESGSGSAPSTPAAGQTQSSTGANPTLTMTMATPMPSAMTSGFVASGMLSPLTPGLVPPT